MRRRNISLFFDGTSQNRSLQDAAVWSNVPLLHDAVAPVKTPLLAQTRKYIDGVGTRPGEAITGGGFGIDLDKRVEEGYDYIYQEVNNALEDGEDPRLYLFGFSRGAFAARWLASLIQFAGIRRDDVSTREIMQWHRNGDQDGVDGLRRRRLTIDGVPIEYMGLWDTVEASVDPSFGIEVVPACVRKAWQALAIDEWRVTFKPTRFDASDRVVETWFPGSHTDIGGGYVERAIANESLWWIESGAKAAGLQIDEDRLDGAVASRSSALKYHDEHDGLLWKPLNVAAGYPDKYFREIRAADGMHASVAAFAGSAPSDRQTIPSTCVAMGPMRYSAENLA